MAAHKKIQAGIISNPTAHITEQMAPHILAFQNNLTQRIAEFDSPEKYTQLLSRCPQSDWAVPTEQPQIQPLN